MKESKISHTFHGMNGRTTIRLILSEDPLSASFPNRYPFKNPFKNPFIIIHKYAQ